MLPNTISFMLILIFTTIFNAFPTKSDELKTYIVHLSLPEGQEVTQLDKLEEWYNSYLSKIASGSNEKPKMVYPYRRVITGFAAKMSNEQAKVMENLDGVLFVSPEKSYELHTTHSPRFLGLRQNKGVWKDSHYGKGTVIALLDSGITPGHPSFDDKGIPPPPLKWKGKCEWAWTLAIEEGADVISRSLEHINLVGSAMGKAVKEAGGAAMILANDKLTGNSVAVEVQVRPSSHVGYREGVAIKKYLNSTSSPVATIIQRGTVLGVKSAPEVTVFSSRGPNIATGIMKPDIDGPGVDILAAWHKSVDNNTGTQATFNIISGTSMSCPHLAGIAALIKSTHPDWSPAAIKSAIMTTASNVSLNGRFIVDERDHPADIFTIGSGHVEVSKANDPGLILDIQPDDYIPYLCGLGYTPKKVQIIVKKTVSCSKTIPEAQLNYPSFVVELKRCERKEYTRILTNVGWENSTYTIGDISPPQGVDIEVLSHSQQLSFTALHQKLPLRVIFARGCKDRVNVPYFYDFIVLESGKYSVRIPYVIMYK
ncbi:peptidase S8/S53 domain-containing protein [Tanacetum coccineum]